MKNIHLLPTNKPSRFFLTNKGQFNFRESYVPDTIQTCKNYNIYITSDEEIKEGDWFINESNQIEKGIEYYDYKVLSPECKKIILTTDQDLIADGVQAIDDEFLEWFVKNPSCEIVEVRKEKIILGEVAGTTYTDFNYKIIIPQEEPKQETLEEAAENWSNEGTW